MKLKQLALLSLVFLGLYSCQTEELETIEDSQEFITLNLESFIPSQEFDNTPKGKYVGIFGHHTNRELHGKIFINAGQFDQYNAKVKLVNGGELLFKGTPEVKDGSIIRFEGKEGSFRVNLQNYNETLQSTVTLFDEQTEGYIALRKSTRGDSTFVLKGTYVDSSDPNFTGNWDLMGDDLTEVIDVDVDMPPLITGTLSIPVQRMFSLFISHSGSSTPFSDNTFEMNTQNTCFAGLVPGLTLPDEPVFIVENISLNTDGAITPIGGLGSLSAGGQTSVFNGEVATWNLTRSTPITFPLFVPEMFFNEDCSTGTSGSWSWNGRSGTISIGPL